MLGIDPAFRRRPHYDLESVQPRCSRCGYDLRATVTAAGATCSECGADLPFDRLRFAGQRGGAITTRAVVSGLVTTAAMAAIAGGVAAFAYGGTVTRWGVAIVGTLVALLVLIRIAWPYGAPGVRRFAAVALTLIAFVATPSEAAVLAVTFVVLIVGGVSLTHNGRRMSTLRDIVRRPAANLVARLTGIARTIRRAGGRLFSSLERLIGGG